MLGDAEGPAHTEWNERSEHFREKYEDGVSVLRFVKNSLQRIAAFLSVTEEGIDANLLNDLFSITLPSRELMQQEDITPGGGGHPPPPPAPPAPSDEKFLLSRTHRGLRVRSDSRSSSPPERLLIEAAYEVRRGDPFISIRRLTSILAIVSSVE